MHFRQNILVIIMELRVSSKQFSSRCLSAWHHFENQFATYLNGSYPVKAVSRYLSLQTANSVASWGCCNLRVMLLEGDAPCRWWPSLETWSEDPPEAGFQLVFLMALLFAKTSDAVPRTFWYGWYALVRVLSRTIKIGPYRRTKLMISAVFHN